MADIKVRQRLHKEYIELDDQYRKLLQKLSPMMLTSDNRAEHELLVEIGRRLDSKLQELQEAYGVKRVTTPQSDTAR